MRTYPLQMTCFSVTIAHDKFIAHRDAKKYDIDVSTGAVSLGRMAKASQIFYSEVGTKAEVAARCHKGIALSLSSAHRKSKLIFFLIT